MFRAKKIIVILIVAILFLSFVNVPKVLGITNATYKIDPNVIGVYGDFTISFTTESAISGGGWIKISFPNGFELPCNCGGVGWHKTDFLVNGVVPTYTPSGSSKADSKYVNITLPTNMNISQGSVVVIQIKNTARIKNPTTPGMYSLRISTSSEAAGTYTNPYKIGYSMVQNVSLSILKNTVASKTGIIVGFDTGILGSLNGASELGEDEGDNINLKFDENFTLPNRISPEMIRINGHKSSGTLIKSNLLEIYLPKNTKVASSSHVVVEIDEQAGIVNPTAPGVYGIAISTSEEPEYVYSNKVEIKDRAFVKTDVIVAPALPDGENGYYKTQPIVMLIGRTNTGEAVQTFYRFDSEPYVLYTEPFYAPEGIHTLYYYSKCSSVTEEQKSMYFKVDFSPPQLSIISPPNNTVVGKQFCTVRGSVSDNSKFTLTINGNEVMPEKNGDFTYPLSLKEGSNAIYVRAVDIAGNTTEDSINITLNTTIPILRIDSPLNDWQVFNDPNILVKGTISPVSNISLTINGSNVSINSDGSFEYTTEVKNKGMNIISVVATYNLSGKTISRNIIVVYNPVVEKKTITVVLKVGSNEALIDGKKEQLEAMPYIDPNSNRTLVPLRFISEAFGAKVDWDPLTKSVTIVLGSKRIVLQIGNEKALINGVFTQLDQPPLIKNGRTMVPIRFISESLGAKVSWDANTRAITIIFSIPDEEG